MKILLVNDYGTPDGGAEIATLTLRDGLRNRGHDALLFATTARNGIASQADIQCRRAPAGYRGQLTHMVNVGARRALARAIADVKPDVVHVGLFLTQLSPLILPLLRDVPSVYYAHWLRAICPTGSKLLPNGAACSRTFGTACYSAGCLPAHDWAPLMIQMRLATRWRGVFRRVVANSDATRAALVAEGFDDVDVIPCGVPDAPRRPALTGVPTAAFCGRLTRQKGVHVLLAAWEQVRERIPNAQLLIAGDGPERRALEATVPLGVTFLGNVPHDELDGMMSSAWVQVAPSTGFEGLGLAAIEALMRGIPVVASKLGGLSEVVQHEVTGLLVAPNDADSLAAALTGMLSDRARCERMGTCGREVAQRRFSQDAYVDRLLAMYESLVAERRGVQ